MFTPPAHLLDATLLLMRVLVALIFWTSGARHLGNPEERSKSIGMSKGFTVFLGSAEVLGAFGMAFGVLTAYAAFGFILIMLGATYKKVFAWHESFWGERGNGWHYEMMIILMSLVIAELNGGRFVLLR